MTHLCIASLAHSRPEELFGPVPQVVTCIHLEEQAVASGLWPPQPDVWATSCLGHLYFTAELVLVDTGGVLCCASIHF